MDEIEQHRLTRRCPVCFSRDTDVLLQREEPELFYGFKGRESEIRQMYADIQKKFGWRARRVTLEEQERM